MQNLSFVFGGLNFWFDLIYFGDAVRYSSDALLSRAVRRCTITCTALGDICRMLGRGDIGGILSRGNACSCVPRRVDDGCRLAYDGDVPPEIREFHT